MYFNGDRVSYRGSRFPALRTKMGEVCARVANSTYGVVVDFGGDSYVMDARSLVKYAPSTTSGSKEPEVHVRKRKPADDDDE